MLLDEINGVIFMRVDRLLYVKQGEKVYAYVI